MPRRKHRRLPPRAVVLPSYDEKFLAYGTKVHEDYVEAIKVVFELIDQMPPYIKKQLKEKDVGYQEVIQVAIRLGII